MFAIAWQYLAGRAVATDPSDRLAAEWPPHPDRVFQALVAAWGASGRGLEGQAALEWLERLAPPEVAAPEAVSVSGAEKVYVPVNDLEAGRARKYGNKLVGLLPSRRPRKERYFPSVVVEDAICALRWPDSEPGEHRDPLEQLCAQVTNIGHSRSVVRAWVCDDPPAATWIPTASGRRDTNLRVPVPGRFASLEFSFAGGGPGWSRPATAPWQGYERAQTGPEVATGAFDARLLVLRRTGGDRPGLLQASAFTEALRATLLLQAASFPEAEPLVSGHDPAGGPAARTHLAFLPLADVGHGHADGHLLGLALALPREATPTEEQAVYALLADCLDAETGVLRLVAGRAGACDFTVEERPAPPLALRPPTWTRQARIWATVTPVVLDRLPPRRVHPGSSNAATAREDSAKNAAYDAWVIGEIMRTCIRQGLPTPAHVAVLPVSRLHGVPPSRAFAPMVRKPDGARRWHVHAVITFSEPVAGPLVLGAGRYRGLGLFRPLEAP